MNNLQIRRPPPTSKNSELKLFFAFSPLQIENVAAFLKTDSEGRWEIRVAIQFGSFNDEFTVAFDASGLAELACSAFSNC